MLGSVTIGPRWGILWTQWSTFVCFKERGSARLGEWLHCFLESNCTGCYYLWAHVYEMHWFRSSYFAFLQESARQTIYFVAEEPPCHEGTVANRVPKEANGVAVCTGWFPCLRMRKGMCRLSRTRMDGWAPRWPLRRRCWVVGKEKKEEFERYCSRYFSAQRIISARRINQWPPWLF